MTTVDRKPIPQYFVHEETTAGPLYFYPLPAVRQEDSGWHFRDTRELTWFDEEGNQAEQRGQYVITTMLTPTLTAMWPEHPKVSHYRRKATGELSPVAHTLVSADPKAYPETIDRADWEGRCEWGSDSDCTDCMWHQVRGGLYERVMTEPTTGQKVFNLEGLEQLDIYQPDPAPERTWKPASPSLAAFYPTPAHHQFPGTMNGLFDDIAEALKAEADRMSIPVDVNVYSNIGDITVRASIVWDEDLPYRTVPGRSRKARDENSKRRRDSHIAQSWRRSIKPGDLVFGETKADALRKRDEIVARYVAELLPPHTEACAKCKGYGYVR